MADATMIFSTVKNPLSTSKTYGYLGYHGRTLPGLAEFSQVGSVVDGAGRANKPTRKRWTDAIQRDLIAGNIVIISTPALILKDTSTHAIKAVKLTGGTLGVVDPSWGAYTD